MRYTVADFFCGCGGFSYGFTKTGKFDVVLGNDIKNAALRTFTFNHAKDQPIVIAHDIRQIGLNDLSDQLKERGIRNGELDCLIGGPPCQGFSQLRRKEERKNGRIVKFGGYSKLAEDPRNSLVLRYLEIAEHLKPKFIVIENVPQMLRHGFDGRLGRLAETVVKALEDIGYTVAVATLNAADYGVPQLRERAVFIASGVGSVELPAATHSQDNLPQLEKSWVTVEAAISDLPDPAHSCEKLGGQPISLYGSSFSEYAHQMRSATAFPYNHVTREYNERVIRIIREMRPGETWDSAAERMRKKFEATILKKAQNGDGPEKTRRRLIQDGSINPVFYKRYYWSAYTRLAWDSPALTITANANFLGSGRFTHPQQLRGITMREAARLQSFPDDFRFITSENDDACTDRVGIGMDMIGEAVPPLLGKAIAETILNRLKSTERKGALELTAH